MEKVDNQLEKFNKLDTENGEIKLERDDCDKMRRPNKKTRHTTESSQSKFGKSKKRTKTTI